MLNELRGISNWAMSILYIQRFCQKSDIKHYSIPTICLIRKLRWQRTASLPILVQRTASDLIGGPSSRSLPRSSLGVGCWTHCLGGAIKKKAQEAIKELSKEYQISTLGELKWFLEIYMLYNYSQRLLWLSQEAYIEKIANKGRLPDTPMAESELLPTNHRSIHPTLPSPDIRPISLLREAASTMLY